MSSLEIHERFEVAAAPERVFAFLVDPQEVVVCLPGAELTGVEGPRTFHGTMKVKVGPVAVKYKGTVELTEVLEADRKITMVGQGKEGASDSAKMTMQSAVIALEGGRSQVTVDAQVEIAGKLVRFGRGMIQAVSEQLFKTFVQELTLRLETAAPTPPLTPPLSPPLSPPLTPPLTPPPTPTLPLAPPPTPTPTPEPEPEPAPERHLPVPAHTTEPINVLPIIFKSMWTAIKRFFGRLFGRTPKGR